MNTTNNARLHPLLAIAAICVILFSLVGIASMTGLFGQKEPAAEAASVSAQPAATSPSPNSEVTPPTFTSIAPPPATMPAATPVTKVETYTELKAPPEAVVSKPKVITKEKVVYKEKPVAAPAPEPAPAPTCWNCGTVSSVDAQTVAGQASGLGAVGGAILGGVAGHQFGKGDGKKAMTAVGAIGGALAGNAIEKNQRQTQSYQVNVRMEDGSTQSFNYNSPPPFSSGDRVKVENGELIRAY